jgi:hypothetical protein
MFQRIFGFTAMSGRRKSAWWRTIPAILTGLAGAFGALAGLLAILFQIGLFPTKNSTSIVGKKSDVAPKTEQVSSVGALLEQYNLFGRWAVDCEQDASPENPWVMVIKPASGPTVEIHDLGRGYEKNHYTIMSAKALAADKLFVQTMLRPGTREQEVDGLIWRVGDGVRQTVLNQPAGQPLRVKDAISLVNGRSIPKLRKCL